MLFFRLFLVTTIFITISSCKNKDTPQAEAQLQGEYFSIIEFATDHWVTHRGEPFAIVKKVYFNGMVDSVVTNAIEMEWSPVFKTFFETDISDPKYLGKYSFSAFEERATNSKVFLYEANDPKLPTRKLQIVADYFSNKVTSIYIETEKKDRMGTKNMKLLYNSLESISIQELETSTTGKKKELRVVYEFL